MKTLSGKHFHVANVLTVPYWPGRDAILVFARSPAYHWSILVTCGSSKTRCRDHAFGIRLLKQASFPIHWEEHSEIRLGALQIWKGREK